ncbi:MAG: BspA family leucine-rich repeat surface protein [Muricauda sp.]|nr:BspA family leucine-rich repeat surface protein [Allomuricauda sp.]MBA4744069.1 BspA family leucine-rich repeat surface protein [Allomuricauda sp.]
MKHIAKKLGVALMATIMIWSCGKDDGPEPPKNTAPVIKAHTFTVAETIADTETIGTVTATDKDGDALAFNIKTNDGNLFELTKEGTLSLAAGKALDAASSDKHSITVSVTDGTAKVDATVTIKVTAVDPDNQSPVIEAQEFTVSEAITDSDEIGQVEATDPEDDDLTFELIANDNDLFLLTTAGVLTLAEGKTLDFGTATEHSITVRVSDGNTTANAEITIKVTQGAANSAPVIEAQEFTAKEDIADTDVIGTVTATDADEDELTFELTENDNDLFMLTAAGELTLAEGKTLDYETATEHSITVSVSDGEETAEATITITVENVIEGMAEDPDSFITTWKTETDGEKITIGLEFSYTYNYAVDWGDGTVEELTNADGKPSHVYATAGTYTVAIQGEFPAILMFDGGTTDKLMSLEQWGNIQWKSFNGAFGGGCSNMVYNATDVPDLSQVTIMDGMFYGASSFNGDLSGWDVSSVTSMGSMFQYADVFNGDISTWDVSNVTNMSSMFHNAPSFNGDLSGWDVSNVTDMGSMFSGATSFNGDLSTWDVSNVTNMSGMFRDAFSFNGDISTWDVSNVTTMVAMFRNASSFNGDISTWDVSNVTNMSNMFYGATSFDQDFGSWDIGSVESMNSMLDNSGMSKENFNATLIGWSNFVEQNNGPDGITLGMDNLTFCGQEAGDAANTLSNIHAWDFTGNYTYEGVNCQ